MENKYEGTQRIQWTNDLCDRRYDMKGTGEGNRERKRKESIKKNLVFTIHA